MHHLSFSLGPKIYKAALLPTIHPNYNQRRAMEDECVASKSNVISFSCVILDVCLKSVKVRLTLKKSICRKNYMFSKKIESTFKDFKSNKMTKMHFWQKLKNEAFVKK